MGIGVGKMAQTDELKKRDEKEVEEALLSLAQCARSSSNLMPHILAAVKTYATLGEICQVLRNEFGEYRG